MSLISLNSRNFYVTGQRKKTLNINLQGIVLVFFKLDRCEGCRHLQSIFPELGRYIGNIKYAMVNLSREQNVIKMSRSTVTSIQSVPLLILYNNQAPFAQFTGKNDVKSIVEFVNKCTGLIHKNQARPQTFQDNRRIMPANPVQNNHAYVGGVSDEDDEDHLEVPKQVTPHNTPWENGYKKIG